MTSDPSEWNLYMDADPGEEISSQASGKKPSRSRPASRSLLPARDEGAPEPLAVSPQAFLRLTLENLLLSPKTRKALAAQGMQQTLGQLCRLTPAELAAVPGIGRQGLVEIAETLDYYGLALRPEPPARRTSPRQTERERRKTEQLCLPGLEPGRIPRLCPVCRQPLAPEPMRGRFCSAACRQAHRPAKPPETASTLSAPVEQFAFVL